jgi:hypothetical protein
VSARVLVVAHRTAATPALLEAVRERAERSPATFALLVPAAAHGLHRSVDGSQVEGLLGDPDPLSAIQDAVNLEGYDEIIISTLPTRVSRWLRLDLPSKVAGLGLPVTTITATGREAAALA